MLHLFFSGQHQCVDDNFSEVKIIIHTLTMTIEK